MKKIIVAVVILCVLLLGVVVVFLNLFPLRYTDEIKKYASMYGLPPYMVASIINIESGYRVDAKSYADAMGLMQLKLSTAKDMAVGTKIVVDKNNIFDIDINIELGSKYMAYLLDMFEGNEINALASYNWGLQNVKDHIRAGNRDDQGTIINIPVRETKMYIKKYNVCKYIYRDMYGLK